MTMTPEISVVVPFFNEAESAHDVVQGIVSALTPAGVTFELLLIDDGSTDQTLAVLLGARQQWPQCRVLRQSRNSGQAAALLSGFRRANGRLIVTLDGDGQNDASDIPAMIRLLDGADMVVGIRIGRRDSGLRRAMSRIANTIRGRWLGDHVSDSGCALKVFRREVMESFMPLRTLYSFMPAFAVSRGYKVVECPVRHHPRVKGTSKYGLRKMLWRPAVDMLALGWILRQIVARVDAEEQ